MTKVERLKHVTGRRQSRDPLADFKHRLRMAAVGTGLVLGLYAAGFWLLA